MAEDLPELQKDKVAHLEEVHRVLRKTNMRQINIQTHHRNIENKISTILKCTRENIRQITYTGSTTRLKVDFHW